MDTFVQSAKNKDVWRFASDNDTEDCFGEINDVLSDPLSEHPASGIWEPLTEVSWLPTSNCFQERLVISEIFKQNAVNIENNLKAFYPCVKKMRAANN